MNILLLILRILAALILFAIAAFCAFGLLATFEPPGHVPLRIAYGVIGLACLIGVVWVALVRTRSDRS